MQQTLVSAHRLERGDRLVVDGVTWVVDGLEAVAGELLVWVFRTGEIDLVEWAQGCPGRFELMTLALDAPCVVRDP